MKSQQTLDESARLATEEAGLACYRRGRRLWRIRAVACRTKAGAWYSATLQSLKPGGLGEVGGTADGSLVGARLAFGNGLVGNFTASEARGRVHVELDVPGAAWCSLELEAEEDEHYFGFGERFNQIDQRGREVSVRVVNGASGNLAYKPVPFYLSSYGYGVHVDTDLELNARMAVADDAFTASLRAEGDALSACFYAGTPEEVLTAYTESAGRPALPPAWVFGPWKSRDWTVEDQNTVLDDVRQTRKHDLACSVKLIDAKWETADHSFAFDPAKYPDVQGMVREAHEAGMRMVLWVSPWMVHDAASRSTYEEAAAAGYLIRDAEGEPYLHRLGNSPGFVGSCIDFTNPAAVAWWQGHIRRLVGLGFDGFKTDFGEQVPDDAVFYDGRTGRQAHNVFPRLYNQATYDAMQQGTDGVLFARSAWHGSQGISAIWAGDQASDFGPATGLQSVVIAGQNAAASGFPYWSSDIGGYFGVPTDEVFVRWAQFGAFSPIMQVHGMGQREPWLFEPQTLDLYRAYAQLHTDLFPYLYAAAKCASDTGVPIMRPMAFAFPNEDVWDDTQAHQYLFGPDLLVAPVYSYSGFNTVKSVWLPAECDWYDVWTGERYTGGQTARVGAAIDKIPVFARAGSIVPLLAASPRTLVCEGGDPLATWPDLDVLVYPGADAELQLTDGTLLTWHDSARRLEVSAAPSGRQVRLFDMSGVGLTLNRPQFGTRRLDGRNADAAAGLSSSSTGYSATIDLLKREED